MYRYLFGPVPSRRLGYSLGVDLVPGKTCSFDCVFCQVGKTTALSLQRMEYVPVAAVIRELDDWLASGATADYITLAGAGEPTLNSGFGRVLDAVHDKCGIRTAILSNGSLFYIPDVSAAAMRSDLVKVSLSAWDQPSFELVNRPSPGLSFESVLEGLQEFGAGFKGKLWVEVFAVQGINDSEEAMRRIAALVRTIGPDHVHLNTVVRPPAESSTRAVPFTELERFAVLFEPAAEVIVPFAAGISTHVNGDESGVVGLLSRHPSGLKDVAVLFGNDLKKTEKVLEKMVAAGQIRVERHGATMFYTAVELDGAGGAGKNRNE